MTDVDGDSQMGDVTSSSSNSEDAMFPAANAAAAPIQGAHPSSPPDSQTHQIDNERAGDLSLDMDDDRMAVGGDTSDSFVPGASWNNKKARDEWQRAWAQVEDKNFSLKEFGDPFDESLPENLGQKS